MTNKKYLSVLIASLIVIAIAILVFLLSTTERDTGEELDEIPSINPDQEMLFPTSPPNIPPPTSPPPFN